MDKEDTVDIIAGKNFPTPPREIELNQFNEDGAAEVDIAVLCLTALENHLYFSLSKAAKKYGIEQITILLTEISMDDIAKFTVNLEHKMSHFTIREGKEDLGW